MESDANYTPQAFNPFGVKLRDIEDKQRILKDRVLLIGENLVEIRDDSSEKINEIKKELEILKQNIQKIISFLENISDEFSKFASKEELEVLIKQAKMFQPMEFATKKDLEELKRK